MNVPPPLGRFECLNPACGAVLFESQLLRLEHAGQVVRVCPKCRLGVRQIVAPPNFWAKLPEALVYPVKGNGPWILASGTPLLGFMELSQKLGVGIASGVATAFVIGFFGMLLIDVVRVTTDNEETSMDWPDVSGWDEVVGLARQVLLTALIIFGPALACLLCAMFGVADVDRSIWMRSAVVLGVLGIGYYPMALLGIAMFESLTAIRPQMILPAIGKTFGQYAVVVVLLVVMWGLRHLLDLALLGLPLAWRAAVYLPVEFFTFYTLVIGARLLGILYRCNSEKLGWFS